MKLIRSLTIIGSLKLRTLSVCSLENRIPCSSMICPTYSMDLTPNLHFFGFNVMLNSWNRWNTCFRFSKNSSSVEPYTMTSSRYNSTPYPKRPLRTVIDNSLWKYEGAPFNPIGTRTHSNTPREVTNAV